jgi:hypothetical protein
MPYLGMLFQFQVFLKAALTNRVRAGHGLSIGARSLSSIQWAVYPGVGFVFAKYSNVVF